MNCNYPWTSRYSGRQTKTISKTFLENSFNKCKSVLSRSIRNTRHTKKIMIYALCEKLWQRNFTIAIVVKLLINGLCLEEFNEKCEIFIN